MVGSVGRVRAFPFQGDGGGDEEVNNRRGKVSHNHQDPPFYFIFCFLLFNGTVSRFELTIENHGCTVLLVRFTKLAFVSVYLFVRDKFVLVLV